MASYQAIETRLRVLEDMLNFVMSTMRMRAVESSGVVGPDGRPTPGRAYDASLLELYRLSRQLPVINESDVPVPPPSE